MEKSEMKQKGNLSVLAISGIPTMPGLGNKMFQQKTISMPISFLSNRGNSDGEKNSYHKAEKKSIVYFSINI